MLTVDQLEPLKASSEKLSVVRLATRYARLLSWLMRSEFLPLLATMSLIQTKSPFWNPCALELTTPVFATVIELIDFGLPVDQVAPVIVIGPSGAPRASAA
ncbi:hypothetical protein D3C87_1432060 [compost metagenome]